ncbi:MAG: hypothetical protein ACHQT8_00435 [Chlamydiales bacterium]
MASPVSLANTCSSSFYTWENEDEPIPMNGENDAPAQLEASNNAGNNAAVNGMGGNPAGINGAGNNPANGVQSSGCNAETTKDIAKTISHIMIDTIASGAKSTITNTAVSVMATPIYAVKPIANACGAGPSLDGCQATATNAITNVVGSTVDSIANSTKAVTNAGIDAVVDHCAQPDSCASKTRSWLSC